MRTVPSTRLPWATTSSSHPNCWNRSHHIVRSGPTGSSPLEFEVRIQKFPVQDERMSKVFIFTPSRDAKRMYRNKSTTTKGIISRQDISTNFWSLKRVWSLLTDKTGCISPDNSGGNREAHVPAEAGKASSSVCWYRILLTTRWHQLLLQPPLPSPLHHA